MAAPDKDTIYIDIDDEITGIIDKLQASSGKVVAFVLPKRASVFQSVVNMKLLKRAADSGKKHLVLITSEAGLLPLAGMAGIHVAKSLTSKPEIPSAPLAIDDHDEVSEEESELEPEVTAETAGDQPIGQLAGAAGAGAAAGAAKDDVETLVLDDDDLPPEVDGKPVPKSFDPPAKGKKNKGLHIPNFERFRLLLALGVLALILLIGGLIAAFTVMPKAQIVIDTNAVSVDSSPILNLSTTAKSLDLETNTLPAKLQQQQKTFTQQAATTGQKNNGTKASGEIMMTAKKCSLDPLNDVPAGTGVSSNGLTYITQDNTSFHPTQIKNGCVTYQADDSTSVIAQTGGSNYNGANTFTVAGRSEVTATVSKAISGGTDDIVQTVNQNDINNAKAKIVIEDPSIKKDLQERLKDSGYYSIVTTYSTGTPATTTSASVGQVANNVTVTEIVTYTMFGVKEDDLKAVVENDVKTQIDTEKQSILSQGLDKAKFNVEETSATGARIAMTTVATAGPDLDKEEIRKAAAGRKSGPIKDDLKNRPGVKNVEVKLSPFWVSSVPKKLDKITVTIAEPKTAASNNAGNP